MRSGAGAVRLQTILRRINDAIAAQAGATGTVGFVCECCDLACAEAIELPVELYRQMRLAPNRFAVRAGHVATAAERLVAGAPAYAIVERAPLAEAAAGERPRVRALQAS